MVFTSNVLGNSNVLGDTSTQTLTVRSTSNVLGSTNVGGDTSTQTMTVRSGLTVNGSIQAVTGQTTLSNLTVANIVFTGNVLSLNTNLETTNALTINNLGTATALYVNQNESPAMVHNVAEFWDHTTLAMVIDPNGNVAIHTGASPNYALTVAGGQTVDNLTVTGTANIATLNTAFGYISNIYTSNIVGFIGSQWTGTSGTPIYYVPQVGIGSTATPTANLQVTGNVYVSNYINVATLNSASLVVTGVSNLATLNVGTLEYVAALNVYGTTNTVSINVTSTANVATLSVTGVSNLSTLNVNTLEYVAALNVYGTTNTVSLNVTSTANVATLNAATLSVTGVSNLSTLNVNTLEYVAALNVYGTTNTVSLNVTSAANLTTLSVSGVSNLATLNVSTLEYVAALNVYGTTNTVSLNVTSTANVATLNATTANHVSLTVSGVSNLSTLNVSTLEYVAALNVYGTTNTVSLNVTSTANVATLNAVAANLSTLAISSYINLPSTLQIAGVTGTIGQVITSSGTGIQWGSGGGGGSSQWSGTSGNPIYYGPNVGIGTTSAPPALGANLFVQGNVFVSNSVTMTNLVATNNVSVSNTITTTNLVATGTITGTWTGTNQGMLLTLGSSLTGVANFAASSDTPTLQAFHVPLQSFTQSTGFVSLFSVTAQGLIKFTSTGLYKITTVMSMNAPVSRIALGTNTSSAFPSVTNAYTYVYIIPAGTSPSAVITIPINVQNTALWYYLDVFTQSSTTTASFYATASATITGSQFGTYVQIAPFGNYISSVGSQAAGLLVTPSTTVTLSSPITSNTYHVRMTAAANWTTSGASGSMQISTNGNLQFYQAGLYEVKICLNATLYAATQFGIGSSASDSSLPGTQGPYVYQYAPNYTQDPSTAVVLPLNITDTTKFYYLDVSFPGTTTTISVLPLSTFVSVAPIGSFIPTPMATASIIVAGVATALSGTYVATSADTYIGFTGGGTVTLPLGSTLTRGKTYTIKDESGLAGTNTTNLIKIQMSGTDLLDGYSSVTIQINYAGLNVIWTGANSRWSFI